MRIAKHPTLDIFAREDGAVLLPSCFRHPVPDWTFGRKNNKGYMEVKFLYKNYRVHRIIAEAFLENPNKYKTVDHINRNHSDNNLSNLRWANQKMQADNKKSVEDAIAKYGVRCCDDREAYEKARYAEMKKDHSWVVNKRRKIKEWADTFYVDVATGKYHFAGDLIKEYGRKTLGKLVAEGKFVNEGHWEKMQEGKK